MAGKSVILKWNPAISSFGMLSFLHSIYKEDNEGDWSIHEYEKVHAGDRFFMVKVGGGLCGIVGAGEIISDPVQDRDWSGRGRRVFYSDLRYELRVSPDTLPILESGVLEDNIPGFDWRGGHSGAVLEGQQARVLEQLYENYLLANAALFADRLQLIKRRGLPNDQLYIDGGLLAKIQEI